MEGREFNKKYFNLYLVIKTLINLGEIYYDYKY